MNDSEKKEKLRSQLRVMLFGSVMASWYFAAILTAILFGANDLLLAPLQLMYTFRVPFSMFIIFFLILFGIMYFVLYNDWKKHERDDMMGRKFQMSDKAQPYGDSHFMKPEEYQNIAQIRQLENCKGIILGMLDDDGKACIDFNPATRQFNKNMIAIGAPGTGKSFTFVKNYLYQCAKLKQSVILTDPDCGLFEDTANLFEQNGYIVRRMNFTNPERSDGWDCIKMLSYGNLSINCSIFAEIIMTNLSDGKTDIYATAGKALLTAVTLYVMTNKSYDGEYTESDILERHEYLNRKDIGAPMRNIREVYRLLTLPNGLDELEEKYFNPELMPAESLCCLGPYRTFKNASKNLSGNVLTHVSVGLQLLQQELLSRVLSTDDIDMQLPADQPCIYYCHFPTGHDTYRFLISLFFTEFFVVLMNLGENLPGSRLKTPVNFVMDEFPSIGIIPDWNRKIATTRKYNINAVMIIQDMTQLQENYKYSWQTIINCCATMLTIGVNDMVSAEYISKRIGETSIDVETEKQTPDKGILQPRKTTDLSAGVGRRSLLSPSEIIEMKSDETLIIFGQHNPIYAHKVTSTMNPMNKLCTMHPRNDYPSIDEVERRKQMREEEERRLEEYWATHDRPPDYQGCEDDIENIGGSRSPIELTGEIIREDIISIKRFFSRKAKDNHRNKKQDAAQTPSDPSQEAPDDDMEELDGQVSTITETPADELSGDFDAIEDNFEENPIASKLADAIDAPYRMPQAAREESRDKSEDSVGQHAGVQNNNSQSKNESGVAAEVGTVSMDTLQSKASKTTDVETAPAANVQDHSDRSEHVSSTPGQNRDKSMQPASQKAAPGTTHSSASQKEQSSESKKPAKNTVQPGVNAKERAVANSARGARGATRRNDTRDASLFARR